MAKQRNYISLRNGFKISDLDRLVAERDDLLSHYYVCEENYVERALNREDPVCAFVGPKGVGKSAILQMVRLRQQATGDQSRVIEISPDDLAFNALVNIKSRTPLLEDSCQNIWLFKTLWQYVLSVELLRHEETTQTTIESILRKLFGDRHEKERNKLLKATLTDTGSQSTMTDKMLALLHQIEVKNPPAEQVALG